MPGVINAYHAMMAEASDYRAIYLSGSGVAGASYGLPDLGMTTLMDDILGRFLDTLEELDLVEDTVVLFYADHGDWAGDFGLVEKWPSGLDDCLTRVPLIIRAPAGKRGHVVSECVELQVCSRGLSRFCSRGTRAHRKQLLSRR